MAVRVPGVGGRAVVGVAAARGLQGVGLPAAAQQGSRPELEDPGAVPEDVRDAPEASQSSLQ